MLFGMTNLNRRLMLRWTRVNKPSMGWKTSEENHLVGSDNLHLTSRQELVAANEMCRRLRLERRGTNVLYRLMLKQVY